MTVDPIIMQWFLGILGTGILAGLGFILRTLNQQTNALAVLVARVDPAISNIERTIKLDAEVHRVAGIAENNADDIKRIWAIYDAYKAGVLAH